MNALVLAGPDDTGSDPGRQQCRFSANQPGKLKRAKKFAAAGRGVTHDSNRSMKRERQPAWRWWFASREKISGGTQTARLFLLPSPFSFFLLPIPISIFFLVFMPIGNRKGVLNTRRAQHPNHYRTRVPNLLRLHDPRT